MDNRWTFDWGESHSMLSAECWVISHLVDRDVPGCLAENVFQFVENRHVGFYFLETEVDELAEFGKHYLQPPFSENFFKRSEEARWKFRDQVKHLCQVNLKTITNKGLASLFQDYYVAYRRITAFFNASIGFYLEAAEKELKSILLNALGDELKMQEAFSALTLPTDLDIIKREEIDLAYLREREVSTMDLLAHAEKHPWYFFNTYDTSDALAFLKLRRKESQWSSGPCLEEHFEQELEETRSLQARRLAELPARAALLSSLLQRFGHDRLELKAVWSGAEFLFREMFHEIAARLKVDLNDLMSAFRACEISDALEYGRELPLETLEERKAFYAFVLRGSKLEFLVGEEARLRAKLEVQHGVMLDSNEVRGVIAHPGNARGEARIIFLKDLKQLMDDLNSFRAGEIMVTQMTQPTMVSMAKRASAIVTDEGGITSHAAIIARELDIPCLVGCKVATKIFRTGDRLEVEAESGICRRL